MCIFIPGLSECWSLLLILVTVLEVSTNSAPVSEFSPSLKIQGCLNAPRFVPSFLPSALNTKLLIMVHPLFVCTFNLNSTC